MIREKVILRVNIIPHWMLRLAYLNVGHMTQLFVVFFTRKYILISQVVIWKFNDLQLIIN